MKKKLSGEILLLFAALAALTSCMSFKEIGKINMISTRNIDSKTEYKLLTTYSGGSNRELKKTRATNIQQAIDETVRRTPGGEYLMNVKIYLVDQQYFAVEGDVWGRSADVKDIAINGFKVGDKVTWKKFGTYKTGRVTALKDKSCFIQQDDGGKTIEMDYSDITKLQ